ncbi:MAG: hypothetical protein JWM93_3934, partial [Frankiales bacterium]|nr:hypothetical protein [Frankiales bacterium]
YSVEESRSESGPPRASRTTLTYDDGPRDAEALLVSPDGATRYVVSKQVIGAGVYRVEGTVLRHVGDLRAGLVTGGSWSPDGRRIALVTYGAIWVYDAATWPGGTPERLDLPPLGQAESIAWDGDGALLVGSEGVHAPVYRLNLARAATPNPAGTATATPAPSPSPTKPTTQPAPATEPTVTGAGNGWTKALAVGAVLLVFGGIAEARARRRRNGGVG